jgi:hypothetical protein
VNIATYNHFELLARAVDRGPVHQRVVSMHELLRGHASVIAQFQAKPGRWFVEVDLALPSCPNCKMNGRSHALMFTALEDQTSVIAECRSNPFLDEEWRFTAHEEDMMRELGWNDASPPHRPSNWFFLATTSFDLRVLNCLTALTLCEVLRHRCSDLVQVSFNEVILDGAEPARREEVCL